MSETTPTRGGPCVAFAADLRAAEAAGFEVLPPPGHATVCRQVDTFPLRGRLFAWVLWRSWPSKWVGLHALLARTRVSPYVLLAATVNPPKPADEQ